MGGGFQTEYAVAPRPELALGTFVRVDQRVGRIRYLGRTRFADGFWVGVELVEPCTCILPPFPPHLHIHTYTHTHIHVTPTHVPPHMSPHMVHTFHLNPTFHSNHNSHHTQLTNPPTPPHIQTERTMGVCREWTTSSVRLRTACLCVRTV